MTFVASSARLSQMTCSRQPLHTAPTLALCRQQSTCTCPVDSCCQTYGPLRRTANWLGVVRHQRQRRGDAHLCRSGVSCCSFLDMQYLNAAFTMLLFAEGQQNSSREQEPSLSVQLYSTPIFLLRLAGISLAGKLLRCSVPHLRSQVDAIFLSQACSAACRITGC